MEKNSISNNYKGILYLIMTFFILFLAISAVSADNKYVNSSGNDNNTGTQSNPYASVGKGVTEAGNGNTVYIGNGRYNSSNDNNIIINKNLTIIGQSKENVVISGNLQNRIFNVTSGNTVTFINITFYQGMSISPQIQDSYGGAISSNGTIKVYNSIFQNNFATVGGSISVGRDSTTYQGKSYIENCTFISNYGISYGGAIYNPHDNLEILNCIFNSNNAGQGGAIFTEGKNVSIINSLFDGNKATYTGGAIVNNVGHNTKINGCNFTNNNAERDGGAIYNQNFGENVLISNSKFFNNTAWCGGAIFNIGPYMKVLNCNFTENRAIYNTNNRSGEGGAIYGQHNYITIEKSNFTNNIAERNGGAIYHVGKEMTIIGSIFKNNLAEIGGGAVFDLYGGLVVTNSIFNDNYANDSGGGIFAAILEGLGTKISNSSFNNNYAMFGGALYLDGRYNYTRTIIENSNFTNNKALLSGGAIASLIENLTIKNSKFDTNEAIGAINAPGSGGGLYNLNNGTIIENSNFTNNKAGHGGGIFHYYDDLTIKNSKFDKNSYAAIFSYSERLYLTKNNFTNNDAVLGLQIWHSSIHLDNLLMKNNNIKNNDLVLDLRGNYNNVSNGKIINNGNVNGIIITGIKNIIKNVTISKLKGIGLIFNITHEDISNYTNYTGNTFTNGTVSDNEKGILVLNSNNLIISSTLLNNKDYGVYLGNGLNNTVNYNRIYKNGIGLNNTGNNNNINLNWWGVNNGPSQVINSGNNLTFNYWYVLELSANEYTTITNKTLKYDEIKKIILSYKFTTNKPVKNDKNKLPYFKVQIMLPDGTIVSGDIRNTSAQKIVFTSNSTKYTIRSLSDDEDIHLTVENNNKNNAPKPNPTPEPTPHPSPNPKENETITANASMKKTGIPLFNVLILLLFSSLGLILRKNRVK